MSVFRARSVAWRAALGAVTLYALLLQSLVAGRVAYADPATSSEMICVRGEASSPAGDPDRHRRHATCCLLACAAAARALVAPNFSFTASLARQVSVVAWTATRSMRVVSPFKPHFSARGPPPIF